ncbi:hypothetical protein ACO34A_04105 [Rhizobium sp. ACO-34A]|nr:hypothetical protein [Rhizobium sp. ACO-34A]ATN32983.1 hypothetical protein ACO34A_04105 [Rhizobium sp. ACO-34A]
MTSIHSDYFPFLVFGAFVLAIFLWMEWQGRIRPMFIPRAEIKRMADELLEKHGERAEEMAFIEEDRAWRYSQTFEQGKWRRVRKELERRSGL